MTTETELNEKLARWAGWEYGIFEGPDSKHCWAHCPCWREPGNIYRVWTPDFIHSLDDCFKWLVPKLDYMEMSWQQCDGLGFCVQTERANGDVFRSGNPALALCRAIEKVIDEEAR